MDASETRVVTVQYLHELYEEIARLKDENEALRRVIAATGRDPDNPVGCRPVPDRMADFMAATNEIDLEIEELEQLNEHQQEVVLRAMAGETHASIAADLGVGNPAISNLLNRIKVKIERARRRKVR